MRPVEKFIRFLGKLVIFCFVAGILFYFMQTETLWLYFAFAGVFLTFPYIFLGVLIASGSSGQRAEAAVGETLQKKDSADCSEEELLEALRQVREKKMGSPTERDRGMDKYR